MKLIDVINILDIDMPFWVNERDMCYYYENVADFNEDPANDPEKRVKYITLDGNKELTIEI